MGTIRALRKGLQSLQLAQQIPKIIEATQVPLLDSVKGQLKQGMYGDGNFITPGYASDTYALEKNAANALPPLGTPDLFLTGDFYRGFFLTAGYTGIFTIDSNDSKAAKLENDYGKFIYKPSAENLGKYAQGPFFAELKKYVQAKTGLLFR